MFDHEGYSVEIASITPKDYKNLADEELQEDFTRLGYQVTATPQSQLEQKLEIMDGILMMNEDRTRYHSVPASDLSCYRKKGKFDTSKINAETVKDISNFQESFNDKDDIIP